MAERQLRVCSEKQLRSELQFEAANIAVGHNAGNAPDPAQLGRVLETGMSHPQAIVALASRKFRPGSILPWYFMDGPTWAQDKVLKIARLWTRQANFKFPRVSNPSQATFRVTFEEGGSWSYIGTDCLLVPDSEPTMQLGWALEPGLSEEEWMSVVLHETGHGALALGHEQSHPLADISWNKPVVYEYYYQSQGWSQQDVDDNVFKRYTTLQTNYSKYDKLSIMHYSIPQRFVLDPADAVGWNTHRSDTDRRWAAKLYPYGSTSLVESALTRAQEFIGALHQKIPTRR